MIQYKITNKTLHFKQPAGTSRGVYHTRLSHYVYLQDESSGQWGVGECAPLPDLGCDRIDDYEEVLARFCKEYCKNGEIPYEEMRPYPSMLFGLETAHLHLQRHSEILFDTPFGRGEKGIRINGLIWMGRYENMIERIEEKLKQGFHCIKLKIGAIRWEDELEMIRLIRQRYSKNDIEIRVDANGGFTPKEAPEILKLLAHYDIHSIEQPIKADESNLEAMARLCRESELPIAFDEQLIGVNGLEEKRKLLDDLRPQYIVIKPTLHGGMQGTREWIEEAKKRNIGSWITSALESNIGLNALAHFTAQVYGEELVMPQGLGTGQLFTDNIPSHLSIKGEQLWYSPNF